MRWRLFPEGLPKAETPPVGGWGKALLLSLSLFVLLVILYWPAVHYRAFSFDDPYYTQNNLILGGLDAENVQRIFTSLPEEDLFIPLTQLSWMVDVELFGPVPFGFHLTNVLLHAANMALLLLLLWRMTGSLRRSAFASALVAFHPLRVESVAWITERKDVLVVLFLLLSVSAYVRYVRTGKRRWYAVLFICTVLGMLAKPVLVTLPFLLLLLDFWPLGRFRRGNGNHPDGTDENHFRREGAGPAGGGASPRRKALLLLAEKLPLLALSLLLSLATIRLQGPLAIHTAETLSARLEHSLAAPFIYLYQTLVPLDLFFRYFQPAWDQYSGTLLPAAAGMVASCVLALRQAGTRPFLAFGWAWYLVALFPSSGIVPAGFQWISDRFTYIPHVGLAVAAVWFVDGSTPPRHRKLLAAAGAGVIVLLALLSRHHLSFWKDGATFFGKGAAYNSSDLRYANQYIEELLNVGDLPRARRELERILPSAMDPWFGTPIQNNRISLLEKEGDRKGAIEEAERFLRSDPRFWATRLRLAYNLLREGRFAEAGDDFRRVLEVPALTLRERRGALEGLGASLAGMGKEEEALACFSEILRGDPMHSSALYRAGKALERLGREDEAHAAYGEALRVAPWEVAPRLALAELLLRRGDAAAGAVQLQGVADLAPGKAEGHYARARALEAAGMREKAREAYGEALGAEPLLPETIEAARGRLAAMP